MSKTSVGATANGDKLWQCDGCGKVDVWQAGWMWFQKGGSMHKRIDPEVKFVVCSAECAEKKTPGQVDILECMHKL